MMLVSLKIHLPISCISRPFLLGCKVFRQIPSNYSPLGKMNRSKNGTKISRAESLSIGGNSATHKNSKQVVAERSLLNASSHDKDSIMVGSMPISLNKQHMKYSQSLSNRYSSSNENKPGCMSMPESVTSLLNIVGSEHAQLDRRNCVDLSSKKASDNTCKSGFMSMPEPVTSSLNTAGSEHAQLNRRNLADLGSKKAIDNTCQSGCMSLPELVTSSLNTAGSEHAQLNRRNCVDLGSKKASDNTCKSGFMSMPERVTSSLNTAGCEHAQLNRRNHVDLGSKKASDNTCKSGCMSMPEPVTSSLNTAGSECAQLNRRNHIDLGSKKASDNPCKSSFSCDVESNSAPCTERLPAMNFIENINESSLPDQFGKKRKVRFPSRPYASQCRSIYVPLRHKRDSSVSLPKFDICWHVGVKFAFQGESLPAGNKELCSQLPEGGTNQMILRPGMVLLKHYLSHNEQVKIVKICRELGLGPGGFYQPGYKDGAKLRLQMMCLGLDWDPQTRRYGNIRQIDGTEPPVIPVQFSLMVKRAIQDAHSLIKKESEVTNVEDVLPSLSPNICIVNFYTTNGRLGLHQDRDESRESLRKGLPVVSFSIGDSAQFLYGDQRDVEEADKVLLESGDVLIFGGKSRHVFHGVSSIIPNSAPKLLLSDTKLRRGRLNLTFRQF